MIRGLAVAVASLVSIVLAAACEGSTTEVTKTVIGGGPGNEAAGTVTVTEQSTVTAPADTPPTSAPPASKAPPEPEPGTPLTAEEQAWMAVYSAETDKIDGYLDTFRTMDVVALLAGDAEVSEAVTAAGENISRDCFAIVDDPPTMRTWELRVLWRQACLPLVQGVSSVNEALSGNLDNVSVEQIIDATGTFDEGTELLKQAYALE
jgi:hypothetical protein